MNLHAPCLENRDQADRPGGVKTACLGRRAGLPKAAAKERAQHEACMMLLAGAPTRHVAARIGCSASTVRNWKHRFRKMQTLKPATKSQLVIP